MKRQEDVRGSIEGGSRGNVIDLFCILWLFVLLLWCVKDTLNSLNSVVSISCTGDESDDDWKWSNIANASGERGVEYRNKVQRYKTEKTLLQTVTAGSKRYENKGSVRRRKRFNLNPVHKSNYPCRYKCRVNVWNDEELRSWAPVSATVFFFTY